MLEVEPPRVDLAEVAEQLGLDRQAAPNQRMGAVQQLAVGKTSERVVHDVTSRDQRGGVTHEHNMGSVGFLSRPERADPSCESWKFAMEEKCAQAHMSHSRGPEVQALATRREIGAEIRQALWPSFSRNQSEFAHCPGNCL